MPARKGCLLDDDASFLTNRRPLIVARFRGLHIQRGGKRGLLNGQKVVGGVCVVCMSRWSLDLPQWGMGLVLSEPGGRTETMWLRNWPGAMGSEIFGR